MFRALQLTGCRLAPGHVEGWAGGRPCACPPFRWFWLTPAPIGNRRQTCLCVQTPSSPPWPPAPPGCGPGFWERRAGLRPGEPGSPPSLLRRPRAHSRPVEAALRLPLAGPPTPLLLGRWQVLLSEHAVVSGQPHRHPRVGNLGLRFHRCGT